MNGGARHGIGVPVGLLGAALICFAGSKGLNDMMREAQVFYGRGSSHTVTAVACTVLAAVAVAVLTSARWVSPVAALLAGGVHIVLGGVVLVDLGTAMELYEAIAVGEDAARSMFSAGAGGFYLFVAVALLASAAVPHRWRSPASPAGPASPAFPAPHTPYAAPAPGPWGGRSPKGS
ncbi:hypothetical protein ACFV1B_01315 [Streptomyces sp. NPDC059637]|uniref:hypothetical protein n=1 Tax=Streptomyces sp. NPDC059637 TaxID=3347752 RepID=UPI00368A9ED5